MKSARGTKNFQSVARGIKGASSVFGTESILGPDVDQFKSDSFNAEAYVYSKCQTMNEKAIRMLFAELSDRKRITTEEMRRSVFANYKAFIRTANEISDLEGSLLSLRKLLSTQSSMLSNLSESPLIMKQHADSSFVLDELSDDEELPSVEIRASELLDLLSVLIAERRLDESLTLLEEGMNLLKSSEVSQLGSVNRQFVVMLQDALLQKRAELAEQLADLIHQPCVSRSDLCKVASGLNRLGDAARAHTLLLRAYSQKMHKEVEPMRPIKTSYGSIYCASVCHTVFSTLARAAKDSVEIFGIRSSFTSELALWAHSETEWCSKLLQTHVTSSASASGGLRLAAECVKVALGYACQLEPQGISVSSVLSRILRPDVLNALHANLECIRESMTAMAAADDWILQENSLSLPRHTRHQPSSSSSMKIKLTPSAFRFFSMVQELLEDVEPLMSLQLTDMTFMGLSKLYDEYIGLLNQALEVDEEWESRENASLISNVKRAEQEWQQLALIANALTLAEELPRLVSRVIQSQSQNATNQRTDSNHGINGTDRMNVVLDSKRMQINQMKKQMQKRVEKLKLAYCSRKATDILFKEEDQPAILPFHYFNLDNYDSYLIDSNPVEMPSDPIQQFFFTVNSINTTASDVLDGRDRMILQILTQFAIALLNLVCHDDMWVDSNLQLGPHGLQQFLLDIHFVKAVSVKYHFGSRQLHLLVDKSIQEARDAFDPDGVGLEDVTYEDMASDAIDRLLQSEQYLNIQEFPKHANDFSSEVLSPRSMSSAQWTEER